MRRSLLIILFVMLTAALGAAGTHRHAPADPLTECTQCVFAKQTVAPAAPAAAPLHAFAGPGCSTLRPAVTVTADGRHIYRSAPKSSPPAARA